MNSKISIIFLALGIIQSLISKVLQFNGFTNIGNMLVLPAAAFFVLAILFSIKKYTALLNSQKGKIEAVYIGSSACTAVLSFQLLTMSIFGYKNYIGLIFIIPFIISALLFTYYFRKFLK